ncbi:L-ornithine N5-oxygenase [Streptomyces sp. V3I8]|uniref:lysine N(6)-hydroxylase/L-ornithine N(5)-oxygenase family protein n=1 Tax=Streptomyces sp. V3I8 TaxID=3042279 RepID=UPI002780D08B|nr:SidA/IucD/PvdA family monooxygenase [Streptomyces sp. V3I8]MDQ1034630.1 L-ornithine N5-oxygenase [Streptomyces sp. V3I8]
METEILDVLGVGFGPSDLALAIAVQEHNEESAGPPVTARFLERKPAFGWHRGMLIEGATMQVAFLKDLATPRNPVSRFGFVPYLHDQGRLIDFINHKCFYPSRVEFHDYLTWCARRLDHLVDYGHEVVTARPVTEGGVITHVEVVARDLAGGTQVVHRARNIVVAPGLAPRMPDGLPHGARVRHSSTTLDDLRGLGADGPRRFVVLGAGQSAAEIVDHLHRSYPAAEVHAVFSRFGYSQADDSPFANRIFDPATVDAFHQAPQTVRDTLLDYHANTNYSVVDVDLIEELYRRTYEERLTGRARLHFHNVSVVDSAAETTDGVDVTVRHLPTGRATTLRAHLLICATGYRPADPFALLGQVGAALHRDEAGLPRVERDYRVAADARLEAGVYLCGATEHSHGITSSLLSNTAVRAGEILGSVLARRNGGHRRVNADMRGVAEAGQVPMGAG